MNEPILVTATYSGVLQLWSTTDTKWKTKKLAYPKKDYLVNVLTVNSSKNRLAIGGTNVVKLYDISDRDFQVVTSSVNNKNNVTALGKICMFWDYFVRILRLFCLFYVSFDYVIL